MLWFIQGHVHPVHPLDRCLFNSIAAPHTSRNCLVAKSAVWMASIIDYDARVCEVVVSEKAMALWAASAQHIMLSAGGRSSRRSAAEREDCLSDLGKADLCILHPLIPSSIHALQLHWYTVVIFTKALAWRIVITALIIQFCFLNCCAVIKHTSGAFCGAYSPTKKHVFGQFFKKLR